MSSRSRSRSRSASAASRSRSRCGRPGTTRSSRSVSASRKGSRRRGARPRRSRREHRRGRSQRLRPGAAAPRTSTPRRRAASAERARSRRSRSPLRASRARSTFALDVVASLPERLREAQRAFAATGGLHATGLFDADGELLCVREDVGRHNAMDKVVGWAFGRRAAPARAATSSASAAGSRSSSCRRRPSPAARPGRGRRAVVARRRARRRSRRDALRLGARRARAPSTPSRGGSSSRDRRAARRRRLGAVRLAEGACAVPRRDARRARLESRSARSATRCSRSARTRTSSRSRSRSSTTARTSARRCSASIAGLRAPSHDTLLVLPVDCPLVTPERLARPGRSAGRSAHGTASRRLHASDAPRARGAGRGRRALAPRCERHGARRRRASARERQHAHGSDGEAAVADWARGARRRARARLSSDPRHARDLPADRWSDLDIIFIVDDPEPYTEERELGRRVRHACPHVPRGDARRPAERRALFDTGEDVDLRALPSSRRSSSLERSSNAAAPPRAVATGILVDEIGLEERFGSLVARLPRRLAPRRSAEFDRAREPTSGTTRSGRRRSSAEARCSPRSTASTGT